MLGHLVGSPTHHFTILIEYNAALSGARRASTPVPCSPRSGAEGKQGTHRSAPRSPRSVAEGGTRASPGAGFIGDRVHEIVGLSSASMSRP